MAEPKRCSTSTPTARSTCRRRSARSWSSRSTSESSSLARACRRRASSPSNSASRATRSCSPASNSWRKDCSRAERAAVSTSRTRRAAAPRCAACAGRARSASPGRWQQWLKSRANPDTARLAPADARDYPYCFLDGQFDTSLFPVAEWREAAATRSAAATSASWSAATGGLDDPMLIEELRTKILPRARHQRARRRDPDHRRRPAVAVPAGRTAGRFQRLGRHRGAGLPGRCATSCSGAARRSCTSRSTATACWSTARSTAVASST